LQTKSDCLTESVLRVDTQSRLRLRKRVWEIEENRPYDDHDKSDHPRTKSNTKVQDIFEEGVVPKSAPTHRFHFAIHAFDVNGISFFL